MDKLAELTERMRAMESRNDFLKLCWLHAKHPRDPFARAAEAERQFGRHSPRLVEFVRTAVAGGDTTTSGWASQIAYPSLTNEWTSYLSARTLIGRLPFRKVGFNTRTLKETAAGTASWVAQGAPAPLSRLSLDVTALEIAKVVALCAFTNEVVESWTPATASIINATLTAVVTRYLDRALLDPTIAAVTGKNPASLTNGITPTTVTGSSEATITANLKTMLQSLITGGSDLNDVQIAMNPETALFMSTLLTAGNVRAYPNLGVRGGEVFGVPVVTTPGAVMPGSPTENVIAAIDATRCLLADDGVTEIAASGVTSIQMDDAPSGAAQHVSAYQTATTALRLTRYLNFERAHASAVAFMQVGF